MATNYMKKDGPSLSLEQVQSEIDRLNALIYERTTSPATEKRGNNVAKKKTPSAIHFDLRGCPTSVFRQQANPFGEEDTPRYVPPRPTAEDRRDYPHQADYEDTDDGRVSTPTPPPTRPVSVPATPTGPPAGNSEWFQFLREEREASDRRMREMLDVLHLGRAPCEAINKAVPQVQPMTVHEDLREFFELFETTQVARRTPREAYAATLLPLLNATCKSLALSLPVATRTSYSQLKRELLAQADSSSDATIQVFWEHRKKKSSTWREEVAELTKLARRCAPSQDPEEVRKIFVMEQLTQQLPRSIQLYVRERKPTSPDQLLEYLTTYFRAHHLDETTWESKEHYTTKKTGYKQQAMTSPTQSTTVNSPSEPQPQTKAGDSTPSGSETAPPQYQQSVTYNNTNNQRPRRDPKTVQCYNCKQMGHYAWQCVKVNVVALPGCTNQGKPPVMKRGKIGKTEHLWCMDSGADMCFVAEDLLPPDYMDGPPVYAKGAMHPEGKTCATAVFDAEVDGKRTRMLAAVAPRQVLPYPAIVGRNGSGLHVQWDVQVMDPQGNDTGSQSVKSTRNNAEEIEGI